MREQLKHPILLLITDDPSVRFRVKKELDRQFFILDAASGDRARRTILSAPLDLIILDDAVGETVELCQDIRKNQSQRETPIVLLTGKLNQSFRTKATAAGVSDFLLAPLDGEELLRMVEKGERFHAEREKTAPLFSHISSSDYRKQEEPISLFILRIDQFKDLDKRIKEQITPLFSEFLSRWTSSDDVILPSHEGQFTILLPGTQMEAMKKTVKSLRTELGRYPFETTEGPLHFTASVAISQIAGNEKALKQITQIATAALNGSKGDSLISLENP